VTVKFKDKTQTEILDGVEIRFQVIGAFKGRPPQRHNVFSSRSDFDNYMQQTTGSVLHVAENWRTASEGEWVEADDGGVVEILKVGPLSHPTDNPDVGRRWAANGYRRTIVGTFVANTNLRMDTDFTKHPNRYQISQNALIQSPSSAMKNRKNPTRKESAFIAKLVIQTSIEGKDDYSRMVDAYRDAFNYKGGDHNAFTKAMTLLKQERIMKRIHEEVGDAMEKLEITAEFILGGFKDLATSAAREDVKLGALKELGSIKKIYTAGDDGDKGDRYKGPAIIGQGESAGALEARFAEDADWREISNNNESDLSAIDKAVQEDNEDGTEHENEGDGDEGATGTDGERSDSPKGNDYERAKGEAEGTSEDTPSTPSDSGATGENVGANPYAFQAEANQQESSSA